MNNQDNIIDSRDVIERIRELEESRAGCVADLEASQNPEWADANVSPETAQETLYEWDRDNGEELVALRALAEEGEAYADDCATLIRDSYFTEYARELAEEIGAVPNEGQWPSSYIDWERAADALRMDYTAVDFDGVTYWVR